MTRLRQRVIVLLNSLIMYRATIDSTRYSNENNRYVYRLPEILISLFIVWFSVDWFQNIDLFSDFSVFFSIRLLSWFQWLAG